MCGRFSLAPNLETVAKRFGVLTTTAESAAYIPRYNIFLTVYDAPRYTRLE